MVEPEADDIDKRLKDLEKLAAKVGPRRPTVWDLLTVGVVVTVILFLVYDLFFAKKRLLGEIIPSQPTPAAKTVDQPQSILLGRYQNRVYSVSESEGKVFSYDPRTNRDESVASIASYLAHSWSPQGDKIALISTQDSDSGDLYIIDLSGLDQSAKRLTQRNQGTMSKSFALLDTSLLAWSPSEASIAFVAYDGEVSDIFVSATDGSGTQRVTSDQRWISSIVWIDDKTLGFVKQIDGQSKKYRVQIDGSGLRPW
jgi:hypothetical protein